MTPLLASHSLPDRKEEGFSDQSQVLFKFPLKYKVVQYNTENTLPKTDNAINTGSNEPALTEPLEAFGRCFLCDLLDLTMLRRVSSDLLLFVKMLVGRRSQLQRSM